MLTTLTGAPGAALTAVLLAIGATSVDARRDRLDVETMVDLQQVRDAAISPSGRRVAFVRSVTQASDPEAGDGYQQILLVPLDGGEERAFTARGVSSSSPRWSPDGSALAFLTRRQDRHEERQIYLIPADGGEAQLLTRHETGVEAFAFSPDGASIAFVARDPESEESRAMAEEKRDWTVAGQRPSLQRLWVLDLASRQERRLWEGLPSAGRFAWSADGESLIFHGAPSTWADHAMMYGRLHRVPAAGGTPEVLWETEGKLGDLEVSPDGETLAFLGAVDVSDPLAQSVFVAPATGGTPENLTPGVEASFQELQWADDDHLLVRATEGTRCTLSLLDVRDGSREVIVDEGAGLFGVELHRESGRLCAIADSVRHPRELYAGSIEGGGLARLTASNPALERLELGLPRVIEWRAEDGQRVEGVLTLPVGAEPDARHPLVVNPHGGPEGADRMGFDTFPQLCAARGFAVLQPNYRGSAGRGVAWSKGDHKDLGGQEFRDVLAGIDLLVERGIADPQRVGMAGWSYGGYFSALAATHHTERFQAAVVGAGISNWVSFLGTTDIPHENFHVHWNLWMYGEEGYWPFWRASPLSASRGARTPTLILHGAGDERVPPSQATELHRALQHEGVAVELVTYPRSGHGVRERAHRLDLFRRQLDWLERHLRR